MIGNIQALRAYAAFAVLIYHTSYPLLPGIHTDFQGVSIFFVISGFIMTHITLKDERESSPVSFMLHRTVRIVPLYWLCTLYVVAFNIYAGIRLAKNPGMIAGSEGGSLMPIAGMFASDAFWSQFIDTIKSLLFIPYINQQGNPHPLLAVGWTLNMEMHFYLCFALMLNFKKTLAPGLTFLLLAGAMVFARSMAGEWAFFTLFASGYPRYFCGGILVYYLWKGAGRMNLFQQKWIALPAALSGVLLYLAANFLPQPPGTLVYAGPGLLVLAALVFHSCGWRIKSGFIMLLGASSYALYLTHTLVLELLRVLARKAPLFNFDRSMTGLLISVLACLAAAIFVHRLIEMSITVWLRRRWFADRSLQARADDKRLLTPSS
jgi:exopolysaccharide production protein ExoZ